MTGLISLHMVAEKGHYLQPFAQLFLALAALREKRYRDAKRLLADLSARFPQNQLYRDELNKLH